MCDDHDESLTKSRYRSELDSPLPISFSRTEDFRKDSNHLLFSLFLVLVLYLVLFSLLQCQTFSQFFRSFGFSRFFFFGCVWKISGRFQCQQTVYDPKKKFRFFENENPISENDTISCLATSPNNENVACVNASGTINMFPLSFVDTLDVTKS